MPGSVGKRTGHIYHRSHDHRGCDGLRISRKYVPDRATAISANALADQLRSPRASATASAVLRALRRRRARVRWIRTEWGEMPSFRAARLAE